MRLKYSFAVGCIVSHTVIGSQSLLSMMGSPLPPNPFISPDESPQDSFSSTLTEEDFRPDWPMNPSRTLFSSSQRLPLLPPPPPKPAVNQLPPLPPVPPVPSFPSSAQAPVAVGGLHYPSPVPGFVPPGSQPLSLMPLPPFQGPIPVMNFVSFPGGLPTRVQQEPEPDPLNLDQLPKDIRISTMHAFDEATVEIARILPKDLSRVNKQVMVQLFRFVEQFMDHCRRHGLEHKARHLCAAAYDKVFDERWQASIAQQGETSRQRELFYLNKLDQARQHLREYMGMFQEFMASLHEGQELLADAMAEMKANQATRDWKKGEPPLNYEEWTQKCQKLSCRLQELLKLDVKESEEIKALNLPHASSSKSSSSHKTSSERRKPPLRDYEKPLEQAMKDIDSSREKEHHHASVKAASSSPSFKHHSHDKDS